MEFQLLGPVRAWHAERPVDLGARKRRFVLAVLLLEVDKLVTCDRLIELTWPENPPATARAVIHTHVSRLRAALTGPGDHEVALTTHGSGYVLTCDPMRIDVHRFHALVREARQLDGGQRVALLNDALALWRGSPLASEATEPVRARLCEGLEDARVTALEDRIAAELRMGRHHAAVEELQSLITEHPGRERLVGQLMLALHRSQRTPEALAVYRATMRRLSEDAGVDPSPELQRLHLAVLRNDPGAAYRDEAASDSRIETARQPAVTPRQLPLDISNFSGRAAELQQLDDLLESRSGDETRGVAVAAICGTAGVGKTALAVRWAHRAADAFPDGQLFLPLRGYDQGPAVSLSEALGHLLRSLGVAAEDVPAAEGEQVALYRSLVAGRRMLLVLDNAAGAGQVRPLLPGSPGCRVVVTSRDRMEGLAAREGAGILSLDALTPRESEGLLTRVLDQHHIAADPAAVAELASCCAHLPLALRIAAAKLVSDPRQSVASCVTDLRGAGLLAGLTIEGDEVAVRPTFALSISRLDPESRRAFWLLGLHPGADIDLYAAAALFGSSLEGARTRLDVLTRAHLVMESPTQRFDMHDLLRAYAAEQVLERVDAEDRTASYDRLLHFYRCTASRAMDMYAPYESRRRPRLGLPDTPVPDLAETSEDSGGSSESGGISWRVLSMPPTTTGWPTPVTCRGSSSAISTPAPTTGMRRPCTNGRARRPGTPTRPAP